MLILTLGVLLASPSASPAAISARWDSARSSMERLDFKAALPALQNLVEIPEIQPGPRAEMIVALAITYLNLNKPDKAEEALARAFAWDPTVTLPQRFATPRLQQLFDAQKRSLASATPATVAPKPAEPVAAPPEAVQPPPPVEKSGVRWGPVLGCAAAGVGALTAGGVLANQSQSLAATLQASPHPRAELDRLQRDRQSMAIGSVAAYAVAAAAGLTAGVIASVGLMRAPQAVTVTPWATGDAAGVVLTLHSR